MIQHRIAQYIEKEKLFYLNDKVLVALSGGADSVALLRLLLSMGYTCEATHCNFHLRDKESDRDEAFVRRLCHEAEVPLHTVHFDTIQYAADKHISIEMAARELRYEWFETLRKQRGAAVIAVAHHKDDSVETVLLNLIRGTGINGLLGIRPKNGNIVRPLLCLSRDEIITYLQRMNQDYVTDSTNLLDDYTRNKIRLNLLPLMQEINPSVKESIIRTTNYLNDTATLYNKGIEEARTRVLTSEGIQIEALLQEPVPGAILFELLHPLGFNAAQIESIQQSLDGQPGKVFIGKGWKVIKDRELLLIEEDIKEEEAKPPFRLVTEVYDYTPEFIIPKDKKTACFDADKMDAAWCIRKWKQGDVFIPFGMIGKKRVSDYLTDRKFSLSDKKKQWVLCCGERIAWLIGERTDNRFKVSDNTKRVMIIRLISEHSDLGENIE